jgi:outer membrane lipoprotein-sorting protein
MRRRPWSRPFVVASVACVALAAVAAAVAVAALAGSPSPPPAAPLDKALQTALSAPAPAGITASVTLTNHLFDSSKLGLLSGLPVISGGTGQLWIAGDGHARLELTSAGGDELEVLFDGTGLTLYDSSLGGAVRLALPAGAAAPSTSTQTAPSLAEIDSVLSELGQVAHLSAPTSGVVAGQPAYTVTATPAGGGAGSATLSFDANTGVPLDFALDVPGVTSPALGLAVTQITYGAVDSSQVDVPLPAGTPVMTVTLPSAGTPGGGAAPVSGVGPVSSAVGFPLLAPASLDGVPRGDVRLIGSGASAGAIVVYDGSGKGLIVAERPTGASGGIASLVLGLLPSVTVDGTQGHELVTGLGTIVEVDRGGVSYTVAAPSQADAEAAAQALLS